MQQWISKYLIQTNIWVAFAVTCLMAFLQLSFASPDFSVLGILFFGTISMYHLLKSNRFIDLKSKQHRVQLFWILLGGLGAMICVYFSHLTHRTLIYFLSLSILSLAYSLPFSKIGLRAIPFLKLFLIAFVWTACTVGWLIVTQKSSHSLYFIVPSIFTFIVGITIPFDIRDQKIDDQTLNTIPQMIGTKSSLIIAIFCLMISGIFFYLETQTIDVSTASWLFSLIIASILLFKTKKTLPDFYFSFWIESLSILPLLIYFILQIL